LPNQRKFHQEIGQENYNLLQEVKRLQIQREQAMLPFKINIR
jgi:hypothetical protein